MKTAILLITLAVLVADQVCEGVKFGPICCGRTENTILHCADEACRNYKTIRNTGNGFDKGMDILCCDGATVKAPIDVTIKNVSRPYGNGNAIDNGLLLEGEGLCFNLFYIKPIKVSGTAKKGEIIGSMLPMQTVHPGIPTHLHVLMCDKSDPTQYV
ncbi:hypothetical protein GJAV_G00256350 [Gymnothorax javanicus]|nr:hypothetical protein GJAV_G00256350 [Gymnothorax javanicus]